MATLDFGSGVTLVDFDGTTGRLAHPMQDGTPCEGEADLTFDPDAPFHWTMAAEDPLTVTEFVNCSVCGIKGKITDGRWSGEWLPVGPSQE